jgi:hypothetical protein
VNCKWKWDLSRSRKQLDGGVVGRFGLSRSVSPGSIDKGIEAVQIARNCASDDAQWTHAAVFLYEDFVLEAVPFRGVIARSLYEDVPDSILRVRRNPTLSAEERYKIALCAARMLGSRYGYGPALTLGLQTLLAPRSQRTWTPYFRSVIICSKVFFDAHSEITLQLLRNCDLNECIPAHLSETPDLEDVSVPWLKLA